MRAHLQGFRLHSTSPIPEIHHAVRAIGTDPAPHLLGYTAVARVNPYQALLYQSFGSRGVATAPLLRGFDFGILPEFHRMTRTQTVHFHWINWVIGDADSAHRAQVKSAGFLGRVDKFKKRGGKLVWTVHNVYPHDAVFVEEELALQQGLADRADAIHVMSPATAIAMNGLLTVDPARLVVAPHPNYVSAYENFVSREDARAALGIDEDEIVFVLFGALKAYKGLHELLNAFQMLCARHPENRYRLVVAGHPDNDEEVSAFVNRCLLDPFVLIEPTRIPGNKTQYYLNAADAGLVTYVRSLNSGAALLYLSFGLPVLTTDTPIFRETLPLESVEFIEDPLNTSTEAFADALFQRSESLSAVGRDSVLESIAHLDASLISESFCRDLGHQLGW